MQLLASECEGNSPSPTLTRTILLHPERVCYVPYLMSLMHFMYLGNILAGVTVVCSVKNPISGQIVMLLQNLLSMKVSATRVKKLTLTNRLRRLLTGTTVRRGDFY